MARMTSYLRNGKHTSLWTTYFCIAEKMETISYIPIEMYVVNPERMEILIMVDPMEKELRLY